MIEGSGGRGGEVVEGEGSREGRKGRRVGERERESTGERDRKER